MQYPQQPVFEQQEETSAYWNAIADRYYETVLSPRLVDENPLVDFIKKLNHARYQTVADFGCGTGTLLLFLCGYFKHVWGIDFSTKMLDIAKERTSACSNVRLELLDMRRDLGKVYDTFDIAFMINAIAVNHETPGIVLREINKCIHPNGLLAGIFPSFDTVLYLKNLTYDKYISEGLSTHLANEKIREEFYIRHKMNERGAFYSEDGVHIQKFFRKEEIMDLIEKAGFRISRVEKVLYPWEDCREFGYGYFPGKDKIWDWFISAEKTTTTGR